MGNITESISDTLQCSTYSVTADPTMSLLLQAMVAFQCLLWPPKPWPEDYGVKALTQTRLEYDFIVIGSGSAGSIVAGRLSEIADWRILLLEAGGDPPLESNIPELYSAMEKTEVDWQFYAEPENSCKMIGQCYWASGKMLGGSAAMNGMVYNRGNDRDFDEWASLGNDGWDYKSLLPFFKRSEGNQNQSIVDYKDGYYHNATGPIRITSVAETPYTDIFKKAAQENDLPIIADINADKYTGFLTLQYGIYDGTRQTSASNFIKGRNNINVIKYAHVDKIIIDENKRATGVQFTYKDQNQLEAFATKEIILSAGALMSPVILMTSGIGPKEQLEKNNITVVADLPVGQNLQDHPVLGLVFGFKPLNITEPSQVESLLQYTTSRSGALATPQSTCEVVDIANQTGYPDVQAITFRIPANSSAAVDGFLSFGGFGQNVKDMLEPVNEGADLEIFLLSVVKPKSRGSIELNVTQPHNRPIGHANYLTDQYDRATMLSAIKRYVSYLDTEAFKENDAQLVKFDIPECNEIEYKTDEYWDCYMTNVVISGYHLVGTSKMGPDSDPDAVVDSQLRVKGIDGLSQVDGGIMPVISSGNTNAAIYMIGEKGAELVKQRHLNSN